MNLHNTYPRPLVGAFDANWSSFESDQCCAQHDPKDPNGFVCTLPNGHPCLFHVAHAGRYVCAVWDVPRPQIPAELQLPEGM